MEENLAYINLSSSNEQSVTEQSSKPSFKSSSEHKFTTESSEARITEPNLAPDEYQNYQAIIETLEKPLNDDVQIPFEHPEPEPKVKRKNRRDLKQDEPPKVKAVFNEYELSQEEPKNEKPKKVFRFGHSVPEKLKIIISNIDEVVPIKESLKKPIDDYYPDLYERFRSKKSSEGVPNDVFNVIIK